MRKNQILLIDTKWFMGYTADKAEGNQVDAAEAVERQAVLANNNVIVEGPITEDGPDEWDIANGYGGVSYSEIQDSLLEAHENTPDSLPINIIFDTPGGDVSGVEMTGRLIKEIRDSGREVNAVVTGMCVSAGMWLASSCSNIKATKNTVLVGSIGVALRLIDPKEFFKREGLEIIDLTNSDSPDKRPDISTDHGKDVLVDELDGLYEVFIQAVTEGRGGRISRASVESLKGRVIVPSEAIKIGLIDSVELPAFNIKGPNRGYKGAETMKLSDLLAEHPELQAEIDAKVIEGRKAEQEDIRVRAEAVKPFLDSEKYPKQVKQSCIKAILGDRDIEAVKDMVSLVDANAELALSKDAKAETAKQGSVVVPDAVDLNAEKAQESVDARANTIREML